MVHRDLKLENVLFLAKNSDVVKVVDFGIAGQFKGNQREETNAGTLRYMPPELINGENTLADTAMDIWAIGVMTWLMLFGKFPFGGTSVNEIKRNIVSKELEFTNDVLITREARDILRGMLNKSKDRRYDMLHVLTHRWFDVQENDIEDQVAFQRYEINEKARKAEERRIRLKRKELKAQKKLEAEMKRLGKAGLSISNPRPQPTPRRLPTPDYTGEGKVQ